MSDYGRGFDELVLEPIYMRLRICRAPGCARLAIGNTKCVKCRQTKPVPLPEVRLRSLTESGVDVPPLANDTISRIVDDTFGWNNASGIPNDELPDPPEFPHWTDTLMYDQFLAAHKVLSDLGYNVTLEHKDMVTHEDGSRSRHTNIPWRAAGSQPPVELKIVSGFIGKDVHGNVVTQSEGFVKHDAGKTRFSLVPAEARLEVAKVFTHGAKKYPPHNYRKGPEWSRYVDALHRHMNDFELGQNVDEESGLLTLAHVAACAMILLTLQKLEKGTDDRPC